MKVIKKIVNKVVALCYKNKTLKRKIKILINKSKKIYMNFGRKMFKTDDKLIVFQCYMGRSFACSPKSLYLEMIKDPKYKDFKFVWFFKKVNSKKDIPELENAILVRYNSFEYIKYSLKAKYVVTNSNLPSYFRFKKDQKVLQCWHGTPLKRLGCDIDISEGNSTSSLEEIYNRYHIANDVMTHLISPSKFTTEKLKTAFDIKKEDNINVIEEGYPRNDFLFNFDEKDVNKIKNTLGIKNKTKKVILYAPTFRDNVEKTKKGFQYELGIDFDDLYKELKDEYIILFRTHYLVGSSFDFDRYKNFIYDASDYEDITDLYIVSDLIITDYSSVFFDYANLKRPIIFYMYDLEAYENDIRGFYLDLEELPGDIITEQKELTKTIKTVGKKFIYTDKYKKFNKKFNYLDDKNASKRVLEKFINKEEI